MERTVERAVFGDSDPTEAVVRFCRAVLGAAVVEPLFQASSVTYVAGVRLDEGADVVVRVYQPNRTVPFLEQVTTAQRHLFGRGFPVPEPLAGPVVFEGRLHTVEAFVADPGSPDGWDPGVRAAGIDGLRRCVDLLRDVRFDAVHPQRPKGGALYPTPHSPLFSFAEPAPDVDDLARRAAAVRDAHEAPHVLGHMDWTVRNIRVVDGRLSAAYDWDSLDVVPLHVLVGQVAMTFGTWGDRDGRAPTPDELGDFVAAFDVDERAARAAGLWIACYSARCELSIGRTDGAYLPAVRRWGDAYLG